MRKFIVTVLAFLSFNFAYAGGSVCPFVFASAPYQRRVFEYYDLIDAHRQPQGLHAESGAVLQKIMALFALDAVYIRDGTTYTGVGAIENFFQNIRTLSGQHDIRAIAASGNSVMVTGLFKGTSNNVQIGDIVFVDVWTFDPVTDLVVRRQSTLTRPGF